MAKLLNPVVVMIVMGVINSLSLIMLYESPARPATQETHVRSQDVPRGMNTFWSFDTYELTRLADELHDREKELQIRESKVSEQQRRISQETAELERIRNELEMIKKEVSLYLVEVQQDELEQLREQVKILGSMEPENIVALFDRKTDDDVVKLLALMKPDAVGEVLQAMIQGDRGKETTDRAARLLTKLQRLSER